MKFEVALRLNFIEYCLETNGFVGREVLTSFFGISKPQASTDLTRYQELAFGNMRYNKQTKRYERTEKYKPWTGKQSARCASFFDWIKERS